MIIQHPLDRFSFTGKTASLDRAGREAADQLLTMIGDFRFLKEDIQGICAAFFLLIDISWFPHVCFLAHINCEKLRAYLWRLEGRNKHELQELFDNTQRALPFLVKQKQLIRFSSFEGENPVQDAGIPRAKTGEPGATMVRNESW
jgi:hypothetical protein